MALALRREESAEVQVLYANIDKFKTLSKKIQGSLNRLETNGKGVQEAIGPIHGNTQRLQITNRNVDKINDAINKIKEPLDRKSREERILRSGPHKVGLSDYLASLDRTVQALGELKHSNLRSNQQAITELNVLLRNGSEQLEGVFRDTIGQDSQTVEPLHFITKEIPFPRIPQDKLSQLRAINAHLVSPRGENTRTDINEPATLAIYPEVRGTYMTTTLRNLAAASISTAKKTSPEANYRQGTNAISTYSKGIEILYLAEYEYICTIFTRETWGQVYISTCQSSLNEFSKTLKELDAFIKQNLLTDCYLAYEIVDIVSNLAFRLESQTGELKQRILDALQPVRETAKSSLPLLLNDIRTRVNLLATLPQDGSTVPVTDVAITRLQTMTAYLPSLSSILTSLGDRGWSSPPVSPSSASITAKSFDVGADGRGLFVNYALDNIEVLLTSLESKSRILHKLKSTQGVFLANNVAVIDRLVRSSDLNDLLLPAISIKLETWRKKASGTYLEAWREPSAHLLDVQYTSRASRPQSGQAVDSAAVVKTLSSKDRDAIKEKWKAFSTSFEECVARHKSLKMEKEVRSAFARDVQSTIEPLYGRFWDRYHDIDKGKGKYVKYDKGQLATVLTGLG